MAKSLSFSSYFRSLTAKNDGFGIVCEHLNKDGKKGVDETPPYSHNTRHFLKGKRKSDKAT